MIGGLHVASAVSSGSPWLGIPTRIGGSSVLYFQSEVPPPLLQVRAKKIFELGRLDGVNRQKVWFWYEPTLKLDTPYGISQIAEKLNHYRPDVFIIDPLYKSLSGQMSDQQSVTVILDTLDNMIATFGCSVILISHARKENLEKKDI